MIKNTYDEHTQTISVIKPSVGGAEGKEILKLNIDNYYMNSFAVSLLVDEFIKTFNQRYATRV